MTLSYALFESRQRVNMQIMLVVQSATKEAIIIKNQNIACSA